MRWSASLAITLSGSVAVTGCSTHTDLSKMIDLSRLQLCELAVGMSRSAVLYAPPARGPALERNDGPEVSLCDGSVKAEVAFTEQGVIHRIAVRNDGYCFEGICIGDRYSAVAERNPRMERFATGEEGGILTLIRFDGIVKFGFNVDHIPISCYADMSECNVALNRSKVDAIIISEDVR